MASITETKNRLPKEFVENIYEMFSPGVVDGILRGFLEKRYTTLRVNTLKTNIQEVMRYFKEINIKFERVLWYKDALVIKNATEKDLQKLEINMAICYLDFLIKDVQVTDNFILNKIL